MIASIVVVVFMYFGGFGGGVEEEIGFEEYGNMYLLRSIVWMMFFWMVRGWMYCGVVVNRLKEDEGY
ncbi:hypothetical protein [Bacillus sp. WP8]|uniref:hypothetical protein n=1 Tax=Bacillus sp. WP8 TaxID=756828 RepID=UPI0011A792C4|nr:hypothetical protein [Bacillus sp. WP8]